MSDTIWLIFACAIATYLTRAGGHLILSRFGSIHHRVEAALDVVPAAVLTALIAPALVDNGLAETLALLAAALISLRFSMTLTVLFGLIILVGLRYLI